MHTAKALFAALLFTLMILPGASVIVRADDDDEEVDADEYDVTARVVRISLLDGEVNLLRAGGDKSWERATLNLPLIEGDQLVTGADARMEIQIDARNFVRVGADSMLRIVTLRNDGIALSLVQGTCTLRLASFDRNKEYFEMDAPKMTMALENPGTYRLDVARDGGRLHLTVRDGGRARIYSDTSGFTLRNDHSAELVYNGSDEGDWQFTSSAPSFDSWDRWVEERERYLAGRLRYEQRDRYYDGDIWGAEELDAYGDWVQANDYGGWVWRPYNTVINNYHDWAPYRHGHWRWCPPYGWTWVGDEPWGWAPYHYGRWVYYNNSWCWAPRGPGSQHRRNWWRPALVAFVNISLSFGEQVAWYPLSYGQHDPYRSNHRRRRDDDDDRRRRPHPNAGNNRRPPLNPATTGAVTTVPAREFGSGRGRFQPANPDIAWRAVAGEPMRPRLPIAPGRTDQNIAGDHDRPPRGRALPERPRSTVPASTLLDRPTGAAARQPGRPLDDELRRSRLYNGRNPRPPRSPSEEAGADPAARSTGAVLRPARPAAPRERDTDAADRGFPNNAPSPVRPALPARPVRPPARDEDHPPVDENAAPERRAERPPRRPPRADAPPSSPTEEAPARPPSNPERIERHPARPDRPAHIDRDVPVERPARQQERRETQTPQTEPVQHERQRPDPPSPRREEPPPRAEPAHREETPPPQPSSPPPPREETPPPRAREPEREEHVRPARPSEENRNMTPLD
jgi:hypothetical protein